LVRISCCSNAEEPLAAVKLKYVSSLVIRIRRPIGINLRFEQEFPEEHSALHQRASVTVRIIMYEIGKKWYYVLELAYPYDRSGQSYLENCEVIRKLG
jgi:hypothetical protein